jgi:hypothetical protein
MTIQDLIDQFEIQGAYCIKRWRYDWEDYAVFAEGKDFEDEKWKLNEDCLNSTISYMYAVDGVLHIELEWE